MKRDKYGRFISNKTEGIDKGKPKRDAKGRFLPKEPAPRVSKETIESIDQIMSIIESCEEKARTKLFSIPKLTGLTGTHRLSDLPAKPNDLTDELKLSEPPKIPEPIYWPESPDPINLPEPPQLSDMLINLSKTNRQKYTIDDIRKAYIAGLNDSQGILSISKRFEMYCKRNDIE